MTHTPGPWRVDPSYNPTGGELFAIGALYQWPEGENAFVGIAFTPCKGVGPYAAHREADARLIAAAPELLEALKGLLADIEDYQRINNIGGEQNHAQVMARSAIAKAEGK